ncbi:hypothetical protein ABPG72_019603 [Tetrahymena utriculariae]
MYSLVKALWSMYFEKPTLKVLIVGLNDSGKTVTFFIQKEINLSLLTQQIKNECKIKSYRIFQNNTNSWAEYRKNRISQYISIHNPKNGINFFFKAKHFALFWDLGGAQLLRSIWKKYYPDCHGIVFVVDQDYASKKEELIKTFESIINSPESQGVPILILINKIENQQDPNRPIVDEISTILSISLVHNRKIIVQCCSAINGINIDKSMEMLFEQIIRLSTQK